MAQAPEALKVFPSALLSGRVAGEEQGRVLMCTCKDCMGGDLEGEGNEHEC